LPRALLLVLDSLGCGGAEDAARFGDAGADTLGHIAAACAKGEGNDGKSSIFMLLPSWC
jgi:phosphopentomutase